MRKECSLAVYMALLSVVIVLAPARSMADSEVINIDLQKSSTEEFVDFLYEFAGANRLSIEWFGWYAVDDPSRWFERSKNSREDFKVTLYLMSIDLGYVVFTTGFDEGWLKAAVGTGDPPRDEWRMIVAQLRKELRERDFTH